MTSRAHDFARASNLELYLFWASAETRPRLGGGLPGIARILRAPTPGPETWSHWEVGNGWPD